VLSLYLRLSPGGAHRVASYGAVAASSLWAVMAIILIAVPCNPTQYYTAPEKCTNRVRAFGVGLAVLMATVEQVASNRRARHHDRSVNLRSCGPNGVESTSTLEDEVHHCIRLLCSATRHRHCCCSIALSQTKVHWDKPYLRISRGNPMADGLRYNVFDDHRHGPILQTLREGIRHELPEEHRLWFSKIRYG
jgi:hypothetical protein